MNRPSNSTWVPIELKCRTLFGLLLFLVILIITTMILYRLANQSSLHQSLFTYHANWHFLGHLGSFTPFSIIPTLIAVALSLWWEDIDRSLRSLQPFVSMSKALTTSHKGIGLSYQSSYWLYAFAKSALNRHWLLALTTLGTFLSQTCMISLFLYPVKNLTQHFELSTNYHEQLLSPYQHSLSEN